MLAADVWCRESLTGFGGGGKVVLRTAGFGQGRAKVMDLENDQSRWASRDVGCPLLRELRRVIRLVMRVIAA